MSDSMLEQYVAYSSNQFFLKFCVIAGLVALAGTITWALGKWYLHCGQKVQLVLRGDEWTLTTRHGAKNTLRFALSFVGAILGFGSAILICFAVQGPAAGNRIWNISVWQTQKKELPTVPYGVWFAWFGFVLKGTFTLFGVIDTVVQWLVCIGLADRSFNTVVQQFSHWRNGMWKIGRENTDKVEKEAVEGSVRFLAHLLSSLGMLTLGGFFFDQFQFKFPWLAVCMLIRGAPNVIAHWGKVPETCCKVPETYCWKEGHCTKTQICQIFYAIIWALFVVVLFQVRRKMSVFTFAIYVFRLLLDVLQVCVYAPPSKLTIVDFDDILDSEFEMSKENVGIFFHDDEVADSYQLIDEGCLRSNNLRAKHLYVKINGEEKYHQLSEWYKQKKQMKQKETELSTDNSTADSTA